MYGAWVVRACHYRQPDFGLNQPLNAATHSNLAVIAAIVVICRPTPSTSIALLYLDIQCEKTTCWNARPRSTDDEFNVFSLLLSEACRVLGASRRQHRRHQSHLFICLRSARPRSADDIFCFLLSEACKVWRGLTSSTPSISIAFISMLYRLWSPS